MTPQGNTRRIHQCALLVLLIRALSVPALEAGRLQTTAPSTPETRSACQVKQTDDDVSVTSEFDFSGRVRKGENYECQFVRGFTFQLRPTANGWEITIRDTKRDDNLARLTPTVDGKSSILIAGSDFRDASNSDAIDPKKQASEREFSFSPVPARGNGFLKITAFKLDSRQSERPDIDNLSFDVSIRLDAIRGRPVYSSGSGFTPPKAISSPDPQYSKEARKAKYQGTLVLTLVVDTDGRATDIRVARPLGMGLNEKAIEAVQTWKFEPGTKDGVPVPSRISVQIAFRYH